MTHRTWFRPDVTGKHAQQRVWLRPENASNVILPGVGHLITQEAPDQLGMLILLNTWICYPH
jgi:pimeloyl-ACP methyl ester carboxylesterase